MKKLALVFCSLFVCSANATVVDFAFKVPDKREDGSMLKVEDLKDCRLYVLNGTTYSQVASIGLTGKFSMDFKPGNYAFAADCIDDNDIVSDYSPSVTKTIYPRINPPSGFTITPRYR